mgnify:CR=1 FL=1
MATPSGNLGGRGPPAGGKLIYRVISFGIEGPYVDLPTNGGRSEERVYSLQRSVANESIPRRCMIGQTLQMP